VNILVLTNLFPPYSVGGYEVACESFIRRFRNDKVTVLTTHYGLTAPRVEGDVIRALPNVFGLWPKGETHLPRGWRRFLAPEMLQVTRRWIRKVRPELCYVWNLAGLSLAPVVSARLASKPVAFHFGDNWLPDIRFHPLRGIETTKGILGTPVTFWGRTGAIFVSEYLRTSYASQGYSFRQNAVIYNGVDPKVPSNADNRVRRDPEPSLRFLFVGRIIPEKGIDVLLDALLHARQKTRRSLRLSIVGNGPETYTDELRKRHDALASDVDWLGRLSSEEIDKLYMTHDVAVVPSTWEEPFGLVALEAMAAGLPVIATQSGGLTEIVRPHFNGALVPRNNAVALGEALLTFASNKELVREYGRNAAGDVKTRFDADRMASKARAFLELVAGRA